MNKNKKPLKDYLLVSASKSVKSYMNLEKVVRSMTKAVQINLSCVNAV